MYSVGYLNGENLDRTVSKEKYAYLVRTIQLYDGFFLSEVAPEGFGGAFGTGYRHGSVLRQGSYARAHGVVFLANLGYLKRVRTR